MCRFPKCVAVETLRHGRSGLGNPLKNANAYVGSTSMEGRRPNVLAFGWA